MKKFALLFTVMFMWASSAWAGGPLVLMGIDAEDGGPGGHGPISVYEDVVAGVSGILSKVTNGGSGILVIGGGKAPGDDVTDFWNQIATDTGEAVTFVNGAAAIAAQPFAGFAMIAIASNSPETFSGGLTQAENDALAGRQADIATFVNGGGGLLGLSQNSMTNPYAYLADVGAFTFNFPPLYDDITPTAEGLAIGITDALDVCCWHDEYITFPSFLKVLATNVDTGNPAAIGGEEVTIGLQSIGTAQFTLRQERPGVPNDQFVEVAVFGELAINPVTEDVTIELSEAICSGIFSSLFMPAGSFTARSGGKVALFQGVVADGVTGANVTATVRITKERAGHKLALDFKDANYICLEGGDNRKVKTTLKVGDDTVSGSQCFERLSDGDLFWPPDSGVVCP